MRHVARKVATMEGGLVGFRGGITAGMQFSRQVDLYMTILNFTLDLLFFYYIDDDNEEACDTAVTLHVT